MLKVAGIETFYGRAHILHDVSLNVGKGEVVALLGRNGSGKTTTLKSIMQLVRPAHGSVRVGGTELIGRAPHIAAKAGLGYVPEERRIFGSLSVEDNLEVGRQAPRAGAPTWTEDMLFELFPNLKERRQNLGSELSGGEQQMLTIARTLMGNPDIILLDEPSEGLAPVIVQQIAVTVKTLSGEGLTVLLSEQNVRFATHVADRAAVIERGRVLVAGPMAAIAGDARVRDAYLTP